MIRIDVEACKGCGICSRECPLSAIEIIDKKAVINESCVNCGVCFRVCSFNAVVREVEQIPNSVKCINCPVQCEVLLGKSGACQRYVNENGRLVRNRELVVSNDKVNYYESSHIGKPLITAVGAGTSYPCCKPAPHIVADTVDGVEVVTVVTEAPLSYSGAKVKIDTNFHIGEEGAKVKRNGKVVGMVETEEYGSKMLAIGGANLLTSKAGFQVVRTIVDIVNGEEVILKVDNGAKLKLQIGRRPVINGVEDSKMRVGCGSATIGMFAHDLSGVVDEAIILDYHVTGLLSEHLAGEDAGMKWSGVVPNARKSTRGRYFGEHGEGWGGTDIDNPIDAIKEVDMSVAKPGIKVLVTETTGQKAALFQIKEDGQPVAIEMTEGVQKAVNKIADNCEDSRVSAVFSGGFGGSARAGVSRNPIKVTRAIHSGEAKMTVGGAAVYVLPGGGINFMVDVEKVVANAFTWVPTPATVVPVEITMEKSKYIEIGGHAYAIKTLDQIKKEKND